MENLQGIATINIKVKKAGTDEWVDADTVTTNDIKLTEE